MWVYIPKTSFESSRSAQGQLVSTWESDSLFQRLALVFTLKGKHRSATSWSRASRREPWIRALCSVICDSSTDGRFEDFLTWLSVARPVKGSRLQESENSTTTSETSGRSSEGYFARWHPPTASWRTSQASLFPTEDGNSLPPSFGYSESWPKTGSMRNGCVFRSPTSEAVSVGSECFSWDADAKTWQTMTSTDAHGHGYVYQQGDHDNPFLTLAGQAELWSTPRASDGEKGGPNQSFTAGGIPLPAQTADWATPRASDNENRTTHNAPTHGESHGMTLAGQTDDWATPSARDWKSGEASQETLQGNARPLNEQATAWQTPASPSGHRVRDWVVTALSITSSNFSDATLERLGRSISQNCETPSDGSESSKSGQTSLPRSQRKRLNPMFVTWLMNFPEFWLYPVSINLGRWEMPAVRFNAAWLSRYYGKESIGESGEG